MLSSVQFQARQVRSGVLILALMDDKELSPKAREASRELARIKVDVLQANLLSVVAGSCESEGPVSSETQSPDPSVAAGPRPASRTPALDQFTINLTERATNGLIDPVIGREAEVRQMVDILIGADRITRY